jgi:putative transposase
MVDNTLDRQFDVEAPDRVWVTDITYIRTQEGFAYLAMVIDLYSRRVIGWSMQSRQTTDVVLQALLMAVWRRKPKAKVLIHSDQGSQFTSMDCDAFLRAHNLEHSMSRRGNCRTTRWPKASSTSSIGNGSDGKPIGSAKKPGRTCSITSRCFTTRSTNMRGTGCCHQSSSNGGRR